MKKQILTTGFVLFTFMLPLKATAASFSQLYVFGDSLSDTGNLFQATGIPPSPPYYEGRASNGPLWVDYLANDLGLTPQQQTNYAFIGATSGSVNNNPIPPGVQVTLPGLQQQLDSFKAANTQADPNALYVVWAGANDYLGGNTANPAVPVTNLSNAVTSLTNSGAKNILVANLPNLGAIPLANADPLTGASLNILSELHNTGLSASLDFLSQTTNANIIPLDVNSLFNQAIATPEKFGFTNVTDACLSQNGICSNPNEYLFWDDFHPTTVAHRQIGGLAFAALESKDVPEPTTALGILAVGTLGIAIRKRQHQKASTS